MQQIRPGDRVRVSVKFAPTHPVGEYVGAVTRILARPMWPSGRDVEVELDDPQLWRKDASCWPHYLGPTVFTRNQIEILKVDSEPEI